MPSLQLTAVADKGSTDRCDGEDWVALDNTGTAEIALAGYVLHDDKGPDDSKAYTFAADATIAAGATTTLCKDAAGSFEFGIGGDDTVTLLDAGRVLVDSSGQLGDQGALNHVWTRAAPGTWAYQVLGTLEPTQTPTSAPAVGITPPPTPPLQLTAIADKGSTDRCDGEDWVALANTGTAEIALADYMLHDDNGPTDDKAFVFPATASIAAGENRTLCKDVADSFVFGIGGDDTVTLLDATGAWVDSSGELGDQGALNYVWIRTESGWEHQVLGTLAPSAATIGSISDYSWGVDMDAMCSKHFDEDADPDLDTSQYPTLCASIVTHDGFQMSDSPKVPAAFVIGAAGTVLYSGTIGIEIRGKSSQGWPKKCGNLTFGGCFGDHFPCHCTPPPASQSHTHTHARCHVLYLLPMLVRC